MAGGGGPPDPPVRRRRTAEVTPAGVVAVINCGVPPRPPPQLLHQQPRPPLGGPSYSDPFHFREMELLTEMGVAYARQVRNVRRITVADTGALRQFSSQGRKTVEEVEEGLFQIQRMHSHMVARANNLVYRLQDVLLQEESNRLRKQMHRIATLPHLMSSRLLLTLLTLDQIEELMLILMAREEEEDSGGSSESSEEQSSEPSQQRGWRPTMSINDILSNPLLMAIMTSRQISDLMYVRLLQTIRDDDSCSSTSSSESADPEREERQRRRLVRRRPLRDRRSIVAREADGAGSGSGTRPDSEDSTDCEQEGRHLGRTPCRATQGCKRTASDGERVSKVAKSLGR